MGQTVCLNICIAFTDSNLYTDFNVYLMLHHSVVTIVVGIEKASRTVLVILIF